MTRISLGTVVIWTLFMVAVSSVVTWAIMKFLFPCDENTSPSLVPITVVPVTLAPSGVMGEVSSFPSMQPTRENQNLPSLGVSTLFPLQECFGDCDFDD